MNLLENIYVADMEATGLLDEVQTPEDLHVFSVCYFDNGHHIKSTSNIEAIKKVLVNPETVIVGHNFFLYDVPALEKMLDIKVTAKIMDSLLISWYIEPNRRRHGLEVYGEEYGVPKPEIEDWKGLSYEEYKYRCEEDVKINTNLIYDQYHKLVELYGDEEESLRFLRFLMTKGKVYQAHLNNPLLLDKDNTIKGLEELQDMISKSEKILMKSMPLIEKISKKSPPKNMYKKDGSLSSHGEKWHSLLLDHGLPSSYEGELEVVTKLEDPKPTSVSQVKDWLFSLGWKPEIFNESVLVDGTVRQVPQVKDKEKNLCKSVLELVEKEPAIKEYEDLGIMVHRSGYLKGFLRDMNDDGTIVAGIAGLTNTLRIKHRTLVNLPSPSAKYGKYIRSVLLPPKGHVMIGADLSGLESVTRNNFVIDYDPEFVALQDHPYYDPHLEIAVIANMMSESESDFYKWWKAEKKAREKGREVTPEEITEDYKDLDIIIDTYDDKGKEDLHHRLDRIRHNAKTTNYSAMYGVGAPKLSKELKISQKEARKLIEAYWKKNWSVRHFANRCETKEIDGQMWVRNPLNNYWYSLRYEKDIFSTVNQSAGDYIFTLWQHNLMEMGVVLRGGFHDEIITTCVPEEQEGVIEKLYSAIEQVNEQLQLKVPVGIDHKIGINYSEVH